VIVMPFMLCGGTDQAIRDHSAAHASTGVMPLTGAWPTSA
jgi:hypothetical protein